ncbi:MAG: hypothetical protein A2855_01520 [Candidatus Liptonbacteria bacterium RIFCSPHIGHO2_01_FULL_57_28]|uniref:Uncharacterized protein n=1 Tax=Candidatus Liptonbacteria bacterium RIFCSPHIGHO2_01_FULL_57_28 TaxID=1798647 RepID=A0A1G2CD46_9BACT|nr:MAG: hypothetical protein A2855_01520 [Candidatus Liptonbacteria bacterium RIFCSPHIGHO2_01_FULL_57_28]
MKILVEVWPAKRPMGVPLEALRVSGWKLEPELKSGSVAKLTTTAEDIGRLPELCVLATCVRLTAELPDLKLAGSTSVYLQGARLTVMASTVEAVTQACRDFLAGKMPEDIHVPAGHCPSASASAA